MSTICYHSATIIKCSFAVRVISSEQPWKEMSCCVGHTSRSFCHLDKQLLLTTRRECISLFNYSFFITSSVLNSTTTQTRRRSWVFLPINTNGIFKKVGSRLTCLMVFDRSLVLLEEFFLLLHY